MNQLTFFTKIKKAIDEHHNILVDFAINNADHDLDHELILNPDSDISREVCEIAYQIADRALNVLNDAGVYYRVCSQNDNPNEQQKALQKARSYQGIMDGTLWIFSPVNGKELPQRVLDSSMLLLSQKIEDFINSHKELVRTELFMNVYQVHLNRLKNKFGGDKNDDLAFEGLQELVSKQKASSIQISGDYMICPDCKIKLRFHDQDHPNYCFNCGKRLKRNN